MFSIEGNEEDRRGRILLYIFDIDFPSMLMCNSCKSIPGQHHCREAWCDRAEIHHFDINGSMLTWSLRSAQAS